MAAEIVAEDLLTSDEARATWEQLDAAKRQEFLAWVNAPRTSHGRAKRVEDATRTLALAPTPGTSTGSLLDALFIGAPDW